MSIVKFGEVSWDDIEFNQKPSGQSEEKKGLPFEFMKLVDGKKVMTHTVRVLGMPIAYLTHYWEPKGDDLDLSKLKRKGYSFMCTRSQGTCILCNMKVKDQNGKEVPMKPKQKFYIPVLDRADGKIKVIDASSAIAKDIKNLNDNKKWGSPLKYDIDITVNPEADPQSFYKVAPNIPEPLTAEELALREKFPMEAVKERAKPLSPSELAEKVNGILEYLKKDKQDASAVKVVDVKVKSAESAQQLTVSDLPKFEEQDFPPA